MPKIKAVGHHGYWFADVNGESLPCVHKYWWTHGKGYHDPKWKAGEKQRDELLAAIREKGRVVLTDDEVSSGTSFKRMKYIAVYSVADVVVDTDGLKFRFVKRLADLE